MSEYFEKVSCRDELPDKTGKYLVVYKNGNSESIGFDSGTDKLNDNISYWLKPVPQLNWDKLEKEKEEYLKPDGYNYNDGFISGARALFIWLKSRLSQSCSESGWIETKDKTPNDGDRVIVIDGDGDFFIGYFYEGPDKFVLFNRK